MSETIIVNDRVLISPNYAIKELDKPLKLGIMASGSGTNFEAIAQAIHEKRLNAQIQVVVYNNPNATVRSRAQKWNVTEILLDHRLYQQREDLDRAIIEIFQLNQVDLIVMAGWMRIITSVLLDAFPDRIINIHPSLLPSFKGIRAIEQALAAGVKITGCTAHYASLDVDSGKIIMQAAVPIFPDDNAETLHARIQVQEHHILPQAIAIVGQTLFSQIGNG
ncbi:MAG: phosphoribosylglycinamide formyltransferase [Xenococcaceae cyanobacterium]